MRYNWHVTRADLVIGSKVAMYEKHEHTKCWAPSNPRGSRKQLQQESLLRHQRLEQQEHFCITFKALGENAWVVVVLQQHLQRLQQGFRGCWCWHWVYSFLPEKVIIWFNITDRRQRSQGSLFNVTQQVRGKIPRGSCICNPAISMPCLTVSQHHH